ncbi:MAG: hypothetical protein SGBAC_006518 [Bacillariaceae sp.]
MSSQAEETHHDDEQYAKDMQLAYNLQAKEEQRAHDLKKIQREFHTPLQDGYSQRNLSPDHMLFIRCLIDDNSVDLLVDTGASVSAMSVNMHVDCIIGHVEFRLFFMVLEGNMPYSILGLDQMRRFRCNIDIDENVLVFGGKSGVSVPFLPREEAAIAAHNMVASSQQQEVEQQDQSQDSNRKKKRGKLKSLFRG